MMSSHHLRIAARVPLPPGAHLVALTGGSGGSKEGLLLLAAPGDPPGDVHHPDPGAAPVAAVLRLVSARRRLQPLEMHRRLATGRLTSLDESVDRWEVWGPRGPHPVARLTGADHERPDLALQAALRHPSVRAVLAAAQHAAATAVQDGEDR